MRDNTKCQNCHKDFYDGAQTRTHQHFVFRIRTKTRGVGTRTTSGAVCCLCITRLANLQVPVDFNVPDENQVLIPVLQIPFGKEPNMVVV